MSGIVSDNTDKQSGLVKTPVLGPSSGSSDPANDTNAATLGDRFINTTSGELFVATSVTTDQNTWKGQLGTSVSFTPFMGGRGVCGGGQEPSHTDRMQYVAISTTGNTSDFGNLVEAACCMGALSNATRGIWMGGTN